MASGRAQPAAEPWGSLNCLQTVCRCVSWALLRAGWRRKGMWSTWPW